MYKNLPPYYCYVNSFLYFTEHKAAAIRGSKAAVFN